MNESTLLSDGQLYLYSAIAQIAGALVGLAAVALTFGAERIRDRRRDALHAYRDARHAYRALRAGSGVLLAVVVACSLILFEEGQASGVLASRIALALSVFFLIGGLTHHFWTGPRERDEDQYQTLRRRGWTTSIIGTGSVFLVTVLALPRIHGNRVGWGDLALVLLGLVGGVLLAFLAIIQFAIMSDEP